MSPDNNDETKMSEQTMTNLESALEIILHAQSLQDLCQRAVESPLANQCFDGAHILLNSSGHLIYDSGYGLDLPVSHLEAAKAAVATGQLEFRTETDDVQAMAAIPFLVNGVPEAVGILILHRGATQHYFEGELQQIVAKLTGFYLLKSIGLGH